MAKLIRNEDLARDLAADPTLTVADLAKKYGKSSAWIALVIQSDSFQSLLARLQGLDARPDLAKQVRERARATAMQAADKLLNSPLTKDAAKSVLESFGVR